MPAFLKTLGLRAKVSLLGTGSVLVATTALVVLAVWQSDRYHALARNEVDRLTDADLNHIAQGVYNLVDTENEAAQQQVNSYLNVARQALAHAGGASLSSEAITWTAVDQFSGRTTSVRLPKMLVGGRWLGRNDDPEVRTIVVDEMTQPVDETATVFQRMNQRGDMLRVATTARNAAGRRAIGTYIPTVDPDGTPNPVIAAVMKGGAHHGRAMVLGEWYLTAYEPVRNRAGNLVGMLSVGVKLQKAATRVRRAILNTRVGRTGYVYALGSTGSTRGRYIISQNGQRDGEDIWDSRDSDNNPVVQAIIGKALALKPGEMATERYRWQNAGDRVPRWKVARLTYFAPWDWVIGVSVYEDELQGYRAILEGGRARMAGFMAVAGLVITLLVGLAGILVTLSLTRPIRQLTAAAESIIHGNLSRSVEIHSRDEIGALAGTFNIMTGRLCQTMEGLQRTEEELRTAYQHLEERVEERTAQLVETNKVLQEEVTERERVEDSLRESSRAVTSLIECSPLGIVVIDPQGLVKQWNPAAEVMFGWNRAEVLDQPYPTVSLEKRHEFESIFQTALKGNQVPSVETIRQRKDGSAIHVVISVAPMYDADDQIVAVVGMFADVTEHKKLEMHLAQAQKLESIGQLAAGIAHEINTPAQYVGDNTRFLKTAFADLTELVSGLTALLKTARAGQMTPEVIESVDRSVQNSDVEYLCTEIPIAIDQTLEGVECVTRIVRAMKDFSHPDSGEKTLTDLNRSIDSTLTVARNEWKYVADMVTDFDPDLPPVSCLAGEFNQVILNLVINAAQAIHDVVGDAARGKGTITVSTHRDGDWAEARVRDTGAGIPDAIRSRIFDPFFTTKEVGRGTGQGLAIAHQVIVNKHGGSIHVESEVGVGTTFILRLPIGGSASPGRRAA